jgi:hypothetical protein
MGQLVIKGENKLNLEVNVALKSKKMLLLNAKSANERKAIVSKQISEDICFIEQDK